MSAFQNRDQSKSRHIPDDPDFGADNDVLFARALEEAKEPMWSS